MKNWEEYGLIYLIGSAGYGLIEMVWRGFTHWTMLLTGGFCFVILYRIRQKHKTEKTSHLCLQGAFAITAVEFLVGCLVNLLLKWQVWDYSGNFGNLFGQICPLYSALWYFLCIPVFRLAGRLETLLHGGQPEKRKVAR